MDRLQELRGRSLARMGRLTDRSEGILGGSPSEREIKDGGTERRRGKGR